MGAGGVMARPRKDIVGQRFGRLVALDRESHRVGKRVYWWCRCDCGEMVAVERRKLIDGTTQSCGCLRREVVAERNRCRKIEKN